MARFFKQNAVKSKQWYLKKKTNIISFIDLMEPDYIWELIYFDWIINIYTKQRHKNKSDI